MLRFPLGDLPKAKVRDARPGARPRRRAKGRQPGHLLCAVGPLQPDDRAHDAGRGDVRAKSFMSTAACSAATPASSIIRSASAAGSASPPPSRSMSRRSTLRTPKSSSARARRWRRGAFICATSTGSATAASKIFGARGLDIAVRVRSTREPTPARLTPGGDVELAEAESRRVARPGLRLLRLRRARRARAGRRIHSGPELTIPSPAEAGEGRIGLIAPETLGLVIGGVDAREALLQHRTHVGMREDVEIAVDDPLQARAPRLPRARCPWRRLRAFARHSAAPAADSGASASFASVGRRVALAEGDAGARKARA